MDLRTVAALAPAVAPRLAPPPHTPAAVTLSRAVRGTLGGSATATLR
jgi:hypothetical protein